MAIRQSVTAAASADRAIHLHSGAGRARREAAGRGANEGSDARAASGSVRTVTAGTRMDCLLRGANFISANAIIQQASRPKHAPDWTEGRPTSSSSGGLGVFV